MKIIFISIFLLLCSTQQIFSGTRDPNTPDQEYIEYGEKFPFIGRLIVINSKKELMNGSAVAYNDKILITAAHVLEDKQDCYVNINNKNILILKTLSHKDFKEENFGRYDIAICLCEKSIGLDWYPPLYEEEDELNKICSMGGYGLTGTFKSGFSNSGSDVRRAGSNKIDSIYSDLLVCNPSINNKTKLEFCICPGDSGGGLFIGNKLAGINSCIMADNRKSKGDYGSESGHTRISKYVPWIKESIKELDTKIDESTK